MKISLIFATEAVAAAIPDHQRPNLHHLICRLLFWTHCCHGDRPTCWVL